MDTNDKAHFQSIMIGVGELYSKEITKPLLQIYFQALQKYSIEQVSSAFTAHMVDPKHGTFMPKPADLVRIIDADKPSAKDRAELAWIQIENAMSRIGAYGTLRMDDKQALAAIKNIGSWQSLCHTDIDKLQWKKKEFIELYQNFENTPVEMLPSHLPGIDQAKERG